VDLATLTTMVNELFAILNGNLLFGTWGPTWLQSIGAAFWLLMAVFSWWFVGFRSHLADRDGEPLALRLTALALRILAVGLCVLLAVDLLQIIPPKDLADAFFAIWNAELSEIGGRPVKFSGIVILIAVVAATIAGSNVLFKFAVRALGDRGVGTSGTVGVLLNLGRYVVIVLGLAVGLSTAGIDLTALFTVGAVFAVTIGFALQNIAQNFVSGVILLVEGAIQPGDVLEVEGRVVRVVRIGIRSTVVQSMDDEDMILPNALLAQGTVKNLTMRNNFQRVRVTVAVAYASDLDEVHEVLYRAAASVQAADLELQPLVLLQEFADSGINFDVLIWVNDPWASPRVRSALRLAVWRALRDAHITIPFPQVDLHVDPDEWTAAPVPAKAARS
jgi:small-conductance mechanosensitive channel